MVDSFTNGFQAGSPTLAAVQMPNPVTVGYEIASPGIKRFVVGFTPVGRQVFPDPSIRVVHITPMEPKKFTFVTGKRKPGFIPSPLPSPSPSPTPNPVPSITLKMAFLTNTRLVAWGNNASIPTITSVLSFTWGSNVVAQGFFQAGGQLRVSLSQPVTTAQDTAWQTMFTNAGVLTLFTNASLISGTGLNGTLNSTKGYNQIITPQTLYTGNGVSPYQLNNYTIVAAQISGGVQFTVTLNDLFGIGAYAYGTDSVDAGTKVSVDILYLLNSAATPLPTGAVVSSF